MLFVCVHRLPTDNKVFNSNTTINITLVAHREWHKTVHLSTICTVHVMYDLGSLYRIYLYAMYIMYAIYLGTHL